MKHHALQRIRRQRPVEVERRGRRPFATSRHQQTQRGRQPPRHKLEHSLGSQIDPLHVIDRDEHGADTTHVGEHPNDRRGRRPRIHGLRAGDAQQRRCERKLLRAGQLCSCVVEGGTDQVGQRRIGEPRLALRRPGPQHPISTSLGKRTASNQTVDFPIPASPSSSNAPEPC